MLADIKKIYGSKMEIIEQLRPINKRLEEAGYDYRGMETRRFGGRAFLLAVWTKGDWLVRIKHYPREEMAEIAAFDGEGFLCPLEKALSESDSEF